MTSTGANKSARDLVSVVLVEAVGSSMTPFVPVPFVDDYLLERLLRRITRKVIERGGQHVTKHVAKEIVAGYIRAGESSLGVRAFAAAARFVVRKVAVVLDVKKSHDVFGEAIAFALALDVAVEMRAVHHTTALAVGRAIHRATQSVGSAAVELITRAGRDAFDVGSAQSSEGAAKTASEGAPESGRFARVSEAVGKQVDEAHARLDRLMRYELAQLVPN